MSTTTRTQFDSTNMQSSISTPTLHKAGHPHVLIVEDMRESQIIAELGLKDLDARVVTAEDGFEAVERILSDSKWDLIILDWKLPGLNGLRSLSYAEEVLSLDPVMLERWGWKKVPVVLYSAMPLSPDQFESFEHFNIVDFWKKPISPKSIRKRLQTLLGEGTQL